MMAAREHKENKAGFPLINRFVNLRLAAAVPSQDLSSKKICTASSPSAHLKAQSSLRTP